MTARAWVISLGAIFCLMGASPASAQWYGGIGGGVNHTQRADVSIEAPAQDVSVVFHDVQFAAKPFGSPQYYDWRFGRTFGSGRFGVELEFIHSKVIADTSRSYAQSPGESGGAIIQALVPMDTTVQRYEMTHGLNFALVNLVVTLPVRTSTSHAVSFVMRMGGGPTIPHAESTVLGEQREQYEYGGLAVHGSAGMQFQLSRRLLLVGEYKLTVARPEITLAHGTGHMTAVSHHVTAALLVRFGH